MTKARSARDPSILLAYLALLLKYVCAGAGGISLGPAARRYYADSSHELSPAE